MSIEEKLFIDKEHGSIEEAKKLFGKSPSSRSSDVYVSPLEHPYGSPLNCPLDPEKFELQYRGSSYL